MLQNRPATWMAWELRKAFYINAVSVLEMGQWEVSHPGKECASPGGDWPELGAGDLELTGPVIYNLKQEDPAAERMEVFTEERCFQERQGSVDKFLVEKRLFEVVSHTPSQASPHCDALTREII